MSTVSTSEPPATSNTHLRVPSSLNCLNLTVGGDIVATSSNVSSFWQIRHLIKIGHARLINPKSQEGRERGFRPRQQKNQGQPYSCQVNWFLWWVLGLTHFWVLNDRNLGHNGRISVSNKQDSILKFQLLVKHIELASGFDRKNVPTGINISIMPCATHCTSPFSYSQTCSTFRTTGHIATARASLGSVSLWLRFQNDNLRSRIYRSVVVWVQTNLHHIPIWRVCLFYC